MNTLKTPNNDHWLYLWDKLHTLRLQPLPGKTEINEVLSLLPERQIDEDLLQWFERSQKSKVAIVRPFKQFRLTKLTELRLKAAASGEHQYPLPEKPLVTPDGAFRFTLSQEGDELKVHIKTLAFATEKYRQRCIVITAGDDASDFLLEIELNS